MHSHEPVRDLLLGEPREELKKYTVLVDICLVPWGHPYMVALTHDVDFTSVRECRAPLRQDMQRSSAFWMATFLQDCGLAFHAWGLKRFMGPLLTLENVEARLGCALDVLFVPKRDDPGVGAHPYRAVGYTLNMDVLRDLTQGGWETGVDGIDNWTDPQRGKQEMAALVAGTRLPVTGHTGSFLTRTLERDRDEAEYSYDTTFGDNDDAGSCREPGKDTVRALHRVCWNFRPTSRTMPGSWGNSAGRLPITVGKNPVPAS